MVVLWFLWRNFSCNKDFFCLGLNQVFKKNEFWKTILKNVYVCIFQHNSGTPRTISNKFNTRMTHNIL